MADNFDVAIRLADEGVPVRAIARAVHLSAELLRPQFEQAKLLGRLVDLPREDWPPGTPRAHRVPDLKPIADIDDEVLRACIMQVFDVTMGQARILLALIRRREIHRDQMHEIYNQRVDGTAETVEKIVDVQVHRLRKHLEPLGIEIKTMWGFGHQMTVANRRKALDLLLGELGSTEVKLADQLHENAPG